MLKKYKRITRKEMKKDPLVLFTAQAAEYLRGEWIKIASIVGVVVLVVAVAILFGQGRKKGEMNAYDAAMTAMQNNAPEATDLLKRVASKYSGSANASEALIYLGNRYYQQKDLANSEKCYTEYVKKYANDPVNGFNAYNNLGGIYEEKGDFKTAGQTYEKYVEKFSDSVFAPMMYLNAGKAYLNAKDKDAAKRNFDKLMANPKDSREKQEALAYLELMK
jgi:TolA-binding protein